MPLPQPVAVPSVTRVCMTQLCTQTTPTLYFSIYTQVTPTLHTSHVYPCDMSHPISLAKFVCLESGVHGSTCCSAHLLAQLDQEAALQPWTSPAHRIPDPV